MTVNIYLFMSNINPSATMTSITYANTSDEVMREIGARLRQFRLQQNLPVADVARDAGLSALTVINAEKGRNPRLGSVVRLLRALGRLEALEAFLPPPMISPIELARLKGRTRQRARRPRGS